MHHISSNKGKEMLHKGKKQFNSTKEAFNSINNPFYDLEGICSDFDSSINFIFNYLITYHMEMTNQRE